MLAVQDLDAILLLLQRCTLTGGEVRSFVQLSERILEAREELLKDTPRVNGAEHDG